MARLVGDSCCIHRKGGKWCDEWRRELEREQSLVGGRIKKRVEILEKKPFYYF